MKVNILGTDYEIIRVEEDTNPKLKKADGIAELYSKQLIINETSAKPDAETFDDLEKYTKKVIRHEIVHAFFHESGLADYCRDEILVDWLAIQIPKIQKVMEEVDVL